MRRKEVGKIMEKGKEKTAGAVLADILKEDILDKEKIENDFVTAVKRDIEKHGVSIKVSINGKWV